MLPFKAEQELEVTNEVTRSCVSRAPVAQKGALVSVHLMQQEEKKSNQALPLSFWAGHV